MKDELWSVRRNWVQLRQAGQETLVADEPTRARIARFLEIEALEELVARLTHESWLDGVIIDGRIEAVATRLCGLSLEPFEERVDTTVRLRLVPQGSVNAPPPEAELVVSLDADDPPDVVIGDQVDLAGYLVETLALALDPFPRKPGVVFDFIDPAGTTSPFDVLKFAKP